MDHDGNSITSELSQEAKIPEDHSTHESVEAADIDEVTLSPEIESTVTPEESSSSSPSIPPPAMHYSTAPSSTRTSLTDIASSSDESSKPSGILLTSPLMLPRSASTSAVCVTFAPLPQLEPRRRTSSVQLGIAARSQMLRARRMRQLSDIEGVQHIPSEGISHIQYNTMSEPHPTQEGLSAHSSKLVSSSYIWEEDADRDDTTVTIAGTASRRPSTSKWGSAPPVEGDDQDALLALGRMMKGGAKTLWRSLSQTNLRDKERTDRDRKGADRSTSGGETEDQLPKPRPVVRRSGSEPSRPSDLEQSVTVQVLIKEPKHLFGEKGDAFEGSDQAASSTVESVTADVEEKGKVWDEEVDNEALRRLQGVTPLVKEDSTLR